MTYRKQKTIKSKISFEGIGLHTGNRSDIHLLPAPENTGICFKRIDIPLSPLIPAQIDYVTTVNRATTISSRDIHVHTIEHICSPLYVLGIDNLIIEINANEPPIADGSSQKFLTALLQAGLKEQNDHVPIFQPQKPIVYTQDDTEIRVDPANDFEIDCTLLSQHPQIGNQQIHFKITPEIYQKEIAPAPNLLL